MNQLSTPGGFLYLVLSLFLTAILAPIPAAGQPAASSSSSPQSDLVYSALFGDDQNDYDLHDITVGPDGSVYLCGIVNFGDPDSDAFLARINADGTNIDWTLFYGGSPNPDPGFGSNWVNSCEAVVVDDEGVLHAVGRTGSPDFPTIDGWDNTHNGSDDIYYAKLQAIDGAALYATFFGGSEFDFPNAVELHPEGGIVLTGRTTSPDLPIVGGFQEQLNNSRDVVIARFDAAGDLLYSTFLGGQGRDEARGLHVDEAGNVIVVGNIEESVSGFPFVNAFRSAFDPDDEEDAIVAILSSNLDAVEFATMIGASDDDEAEDVVVRPDGSIAVVGRTRSTDLPVTNAYQSQPGGSFDGFLAVIGASGLLESLSYIGGDSGERAFAIDTDADGAVYIAGSSPSEGVFTVDPLQEPGGRSDAFLLVLESDLVTPRLATLLGGDDTDAAAALTTLADGEFVVSGSTESDDFPVAGYRAPDFNGDQTGVFLSRIATSAPSGGSGQIAADADPLVFVTGITGDPVIEDVRLSNVGEATVVIESVEIEPDAFFEVGESGVPFNLGSNESVTLSVTFNPPGADLPDEPITAELTVSSNASNPDFKVPVKATVIESQVPHGLAIHLDEPTPDFFPPRSDFEGIRVLGSGLADIDQVSIDPPDGITVKGIEASNDNVLIPIAIDHTAELGERQLMLFSATSKYEIDVSEFVDWEFFITRAKARFNQAVDAAKLPEPWTDVLVADKAGVLQVQLEDPTFYGDDFFGSVITDDAVETDEFVGIYEYRAEYSSRQVETSANYLSMPFGRITSAEPEFGYLMSTAYGIADRTIGGPTLKRTARPSRSLRVAALRYRITDGQKTYEPASIDEIREAFNYVRGAYPISHDSLRLRILLEPRDLPATLMTVNGEIPTWEIVERSDDTVGPILNQDAKPELRERFSFAALWEGIDVVAVFLPNRTADKKDEDGNIKGINGFAYSDHGFTVIGRVGGGFGRTTAHEIGHMLGGIFKRKVDDPGKRLGDEYEGGRFQCDVNPPVAGLKDWDDIVRCPDSPLMDDRDGDDNGTFTDESSFNTFIFEPVVTNTALEPPVKRYNIMSGGQPDDISWPDVRSYTELLKSLVPRESEAGASSAKRADLEAVAVQGSVFLDGTGQISLATVVRSPIIPVSEDGEYRVALTAPIGGFQASSNTFDAEFVFPSEPPVPAERFDFLAYLPIEGVDRSAYSSITLSRAGVGTIAEMPLTTAAPIVSNLSAERVGDGSGDVDLSWEVSDADSEPSSLRYSVFYLGEEGDLVAVEAGLRERTYRWQTVADGPNDDPHVVVIATDGFNEGRAEIELGFSVGVNSNLETPGELPDSPNLASNYPNPFAGTTTIEFSLSKPAVAELQIYDVLGRRIDTRALGRLDAGVQHVEYAGVGLIPGTYLYVISSEDVTITGRMTVAPAR